MTTRVINIKSGDKYTVYIGRWNKSYGLERSKWFNPNEDGIDGTRLEVIDKYRKYLLATPVLMASIPELKDQVSASRR